MTDGRRQADKPVAPPPAPADVGIVAALPVEVAPLIGRLEDVRKLAAARHTISEGTWHSRIVVVVACGPGSAAARRGAELLLAGHRPRWLMSVGFAGALDPALKRNEVVTPHELVDVYGTLVSVDVHVRRDPGEPAGLRTGRLVTVDGVVRTAAEKADLRRSTDADLVDMESLSIARFCAERSVRFLALRVISDDAHTDLPPEILSLVGPTGGYRVGAAFGAIMRRPATLSSMLRLREHANLAARKLAEVATAVISELP